ncbi:MAG: DUF2207 domain-containing protein [Gammaproteobacteria bacterium]|nr:MAG: DUF2207 domain-containing protein [Gammaproteobacteria bacterium]
MIKQRTILIFINTFLALIVTFFCLSEQAFSAEEILFFDSHIQVHDDSSMSVTEEITVRAENKKINRGIYRDFPTKYNGKLGNKIKVGFEIIEVLRNGVLEPYHTKKMSNGIRIYIGDKNRYINRGEHKYSIKYKTNQQLGFFGSHDELYWNVTGNGWEFPILEAKASVHLPDSIQASEVKLEAYTGFTGSRGQSYDTDIGYSGNYLFKTNRPLANREGLTIVVTWPKGHIHLPSFTQKAIWWWQANIDSPINLLGFLGLLIFYLSAWWQLGRDPKPGIIIPRYQPPAGFPAGGLRYIKEMGHDKKAFTAALLSLAVKGYLKIEEVGKTYKLHKLKNTDLRLPPGEQAIHSSFFGKADHNIELKNTNHEKISKAISQHKGALKKEYSQSYFIHNRKVLYIGILISIIIGAVILFNLNKGEDAGAALFLIFWLSIWTPVTVFLILAWFNLFKSRFTIGKVAELPVATIFAGAWSAGEIGALVALCSIIGIANGLMLISIFIVNTIFYFLLKKPTLEGRKLLDKTEGFKKYLEVAEQEELNLRHPPRKTPKLFEAYLPYALALGVENEWAEQFTNVFSMHGENKDYHPAWYSGSHWNNNNLGSFTDSVGSSLNSAISSSSTAPGSSSGSSSFGGGGSSGGGGGGGGGGGW